MAYVSIEDLYSNLSPVSVKNKSNVKKKDIFDGVADCIYDPNGKSFSYKEIQDNIKTHFTNASSEEVKNEFKVHFHGIGETGSAIPEDEYWTSKYFWKKEQHSAEVKSAAAIIGAINLGGSPAVSAFSIKGPRITPATRGAKKIELFLNYTPPIVVSQMIPYLDVTFKKTGTAASSITSPSIIRFLLGSGPVDSLSPGDAFIQSSGFTYTSSEKTDSSGYGMEMFLMPQTLTNMDSLGPTNTGLTRLNRVKPFVPFASIESFDITIMNAGAGAFAHKKGSLKLKIHDKARLPEISEFIKGASGFNGSSIETVYGWSAPQNRGSADEYSSFVNDNMIVRDTWLVSNCQFSFDGSGQASVSIEMMSQSAKVLQDKTIVGNETGAPFFKAIQTLSELKNKITSTKAYTRSAKTESIFNAIGSPGDLAKLEKIDLSTATAELKKLAGRAGLDDDEKIALEAAIDIVCAQKSWQKLKQSVDAHVDSKFKQAEQGQDPFLSSFVDKNPVYKKILDEMTHVKGLLVRGGVASFGKLFLAFVCSQIDSTDCEELQVFFYGLNDECGYMSGASIAEFPIDMMILRKAYDEFIKKTLNMNVPIESFLSIVSDSHFSNSTAAAFGMSEFYGPADPKKENKRELKKDKGIENAMEKFFEEWGDIKIPIIEMFAETTLTKDKKRIKRIHVYDRQNSPYSFQQDILDDGNGNITIGKIDKKKKRSLVNDHGVTFGSLMKQKKDEFEKTKQHYKIDKDSKVPPKEFAAAKSADVMSSAAGVETYNISERGSVKHFLMKTVPTISIGTNGSLVLSVSAASKADGTQGAINIIAAAQGVKSSNVPSTDGLVENKNIPLRAVPMQVTMTTLGVPIAQLYQTFFIDFDTGTTIDNVYSASQIQHSINQGKFTTNWTFIYTNGYAKFSAPPTAADTLTSAAAERINTEEARRDKANPKKGKK